MNDEPLEAAALHHHLGRLAIPEYILDKPGKLTPAEREKMKQHASIGVDIPSAIGFPYSVVPIVRHHHENWDGTGYPDGMNGEDIPLGARVLSVGNFVDAPTSDRHYRPRLSDAEALALLRGRSGSMYDPRIADTFARMYKTVAPSQSDFESVHGLDTLLGQTQAEEPSHASRATPDSISSSTEELLAVYELARSLTAGVTLADAGDIIAKRMKRLLPASTCVYFIYDADGDELVDRHVVGTHAAHVPGSRVGIGHRLSGWVAADRRTTVTSDPLLDLGDMARSPNPRPRSALSTPLLVENGLLGVLSPYSTSRDAFTPGHRRVAEMVGRQVSRTLSDASTHDDMRKASFRDKPTAIPNVEQLRVIFDSLAASRTYREKGISLIFVEVVGLTPLDTGGGHPLVPALATAVWTSLRPADLVFRFGAHSFFVLLEQASE